MGETGQRLLILAAIVLLPLAPAYLLFKNLPNSARLSGPFRGFKVNFGGAFAGYFALFLMLLGVRPKDIPRSAIENWTIYGTIAFEHEPTEPNPNFNDVVVRIIPPKVSILNEGAFTLDVAVLNDQGQRKFPDLEIDLAGYHGLTIPLGPGRPYGSPALQITPDEAHKQISITGITMQEVKPSERYSAGTAQKAQPIK